MSSLQTQLVKKTAIIESGDFNLSATRYLEKVEINSEYDYVSLDSIFSSIKNGKKVYQKDEKGQYRVSRIASIADGTFNLFKTKWTDDLVDESYFLQKGDILFSHINSFKHLAKTAIFNLDEKVVHGINLIRLQPTKDKVLPLFALYIFKSDNFINGARKFAQQAVNQASINTKAIKSLKIPLPPLEIQEQIVKEIEGYQKIIDGCRQVVENYKPVIDIDPSWEMVELGEVTTIKSGGTPSRKENTYWENGSIPWVGSTVCKDGFIDKSEEYITEQGLKNSSAKIFQKGTTFIALVGATIGKTGYNNIEICTNQNIAGVFPIDETKLDKLYLFYAAQTLYREFVELGDGSFRMASLSFIKQQVIPFPSMETQKEIVEKLEQERKVIEGNKELIKIYEKKINDKIKELF